MKKVLLALSALLLAVNGYSQCTAGFTTAMAPSNNTLLRLALTNTSTPTPGTMPSGKYADYKVYWGDGSSTYIGTGTYYHTYATTGSYTVSMRQTVVDSFTSALYCTDSVANSATVAYTPCATSFTIAKTGLTATVTATNPAGTSGMTYSWNWGDGSPAGSGSPASHTYTTTGSKTITLTATNGTCTYTNVATTSITGVASCAGLSANFSFSTSGLSASFTNTSTVSAGKTRNSTWSFGDGSTSTAPNPGHSYGSAGTYTVMMINQWKDSLSGFTYCTDTMTKSVTVSGTPPVNKIEGVIMEDSTKATSGAIFKVWLIVFDSASNTLNAVDSLLTSPSTYNAYYVFNNKASGQYRVKAKLTNGPTSGTGAIPTYHNSSLLWSSANIIYHTGGASINKHITMQYGTITSGPGFIGGNVSAGANKGTAAGLPDMTILLLDGAGNPVASATTDANGDYSFSNLAPASYSVYPEDAGYTTTPINVSIVNGTPTVNDIDFSRSMKNRTIGANTTGITNMSLAAGLTVYPNPAKDKVIVSWNQLNTSAVSIIVTDVTGKKVQQATANTGKIELNMQNLQKGLYFITLESNNARTTQKLILQ